MHRPGHRPAPWQRRFLAATALVLTVSGAAWLALHYSVGAGADALPHPAEAGLLKLHGAAAVGALVGGGLRAGHHIPTTWRLAHRPRHAGQRRSGLLLCGLFGLASVSAYGLYYFAPEAVRPALGWAHAAAGLALAGAGAWHGGRMRFRKRPAGFEMRDNLS